jgi:hypothetical protein
MKRSAERRERPTETGELQKPWIVLCQPLRERGQKKRRAEEAHTEAQGRRQKNRLQKKRRAEEAHTEAQGRR